MWVYSVPLNNAFDNCTDANKIIHRQAELSVGTSLNIIEPTTFDIIKSTEWTSVLRMCGLSSFPPTSQCFQNAVGLDAEWTCTYAIPRLKHIQAVLSKQKFVAIPHLFPLLLRPHVDCISETKSLQELGKTNMQADVAEAHAANRPWLGNIPTTI